jgi:propanol-preferring alcohol dehydrogenase
VQLARQPRHQLGHGHDRVDRADALAAAPDVLPGLLRVAAEIPIRPQVQLFPLREANRALLYLKEDKMKGSGVLVVEGGGTS